MSDEKKDAPDNGEAKLYRVETVPPPAGEDDAYSAPTKVGPLGDAFVANLMKEAEQRTTALARKDEPKSGDGGAKKPAQESPSVSKRSNAEESPPPSKEPVSAGGTPLPRVYDEEEEDAATKLSPKATPPAIPQKPMTLQVPSEAPKAPAAPPVPAPPVDLLRQYADLAQPPSSSRAPVSGGIPSAGPPASAPTPSESPDAALRAQSRRRTIALFALLVVLAAIAFLILSKQRHF